MPRRHAKLAIYPNYTSSRSLAWPQSRLESKFPSSIRSRVPGAKSPNKLSVWSCVPSNACYDLRHVGRDFLGHESASMAVAGLVQSLRCRRRCVVFVCVCVCVRTPSCKLVGDGFIGRWALALRLCAERLGKACTPVVTSAAPPPVTTLSQRPSCSAVTAATTTTTAASAAPPPPPPPALSILEMPRATVVPATPQNLVFSLSLSRRPPRRGDS